MITGKQKKNGIVKRKSKLVPRLIASAVFIVVITCIVIGVRFLILHLDNSPTSEKNMLSAWDEHDYQKTYEISSNILEQVDYSNNLALTYHGYSAFQMAMAENDPSVAQSYFDEAVNYIRLAAIDAKQETRPQLYYMLGKSYFYKDYYSSQFFYADLVIKYLEIARKMGFDSQDIPEMLGLCHSFLGNYDESIMAFSAALLNRESDNLFYLIAEQYYKSGQNLEVELRDEKYNIAKAYLHRISLDCKDERIVENSSVLTGQILLDQGNYDEAKEEFETILKKNENSAIANFSLGVIYEKMGDLVKARAYWRKTKSIQSNYPGLSEKLDNK